MRSDWPWVFALRRNRTCIALLLLLFLATFPVYLLYHQLGAQLTQEELLVYEDDLSSTKDEGNSSTALRCMQFPGDMSPFPLCYEKMQWLRRGWRSHECYASYGVDGSICSIRRYLSEVENYCPRMPFVDGDTSSANDDYAEANTDLPSLFATMQGRMENYEYIKNRMLQHWESWTNALYATLSKYPHSTGNRRKLNVIIHLGLLSESNLRIGEKSRSGGPLGELLQWSDLIACVFLLGHNLYISTEKASLIRHVDQFPVNSPCPSRRRQVDLVITDIIGLRSFKARKDFLLRNRCRIRLVDSFGTQTEFNYRSYFNAHKAALSAKDSLTNPWGGHGLQLLQHWTFFPHSPDNGFLGFAIHASNVKPLFERNSLGRPVSLVYGKEKYMWNGSEAVVELLKNLTEVHATVSDLNDTDHPMFSGVVNHGFLSAAEVAALLKSVNIFVGLGFPFEGPAPLEALASGAVFINPRFEPSKSRRNTPFLRDKPTLREFTSQSPYLERIGPPHVYTVDFNDISALESVIRKAVEEKPVPFIPEEFSPHGMLIRVNMLLYRDLCSSVSVWPPPNKLVPVISSPDESCEKSCESTGLVCEPSFFPLVNMAAVMSSVAGCSPAEVGNSTEPYAPFNCSHQASSLMFSCATRPPPGSGVVRLCPCRDYMPEQISFCKTCVS